MALAALRAEHRSTPRHGIAVKIRLRVKGGQIDRNKVADQSGIRHLMRIDLFGHLTSRGIAKKSCRGP